VAIGFYNENSGLKIDYALWKKSLRNSDFSNVFSFGVATLGLLLFNSIYH
jgi:hypothetical protein